MNEKIFGAGDGAHCGLADWYPENESALEAALSSGKGFTTDWYASKKEIASACISSADGKSILIEVSVSDDFDTEGYGSERIEAPATLEDVANAIYRVWDCALAAQKDGRLYAGYSLILHTAKIPEWLKSDCVIPRETRKRYPRKRPLCVDYYIACLDGDLDVPPGDNYYYWHWQNDVDGDGARCLEKGIPKSTVRQFEEFANNQSNGSLRIGDWEIASWDKEAE